MAKERKQYAAHEKVAVLRRHLLEHIPVSELCAELSLRSTFFSTQHRNFAKNLPNPATGRMRRLNLAPTPPTRYNGKVRLD